MTTHIKPPSQQLHSIKEFLSYDPEAGRFDWIKRPRGGGRWRQGNEAGCLDPLGYRKINWKGRSYLAHRLAWWFVYGVWPARLDHIDGNPGNNAIANLRECDQRQNSGNQSGWVRSGKKYKGVFRAGKTRFSAACAGKYLGCFASEEDAARAYDKEALLHFGAFAKLNFPQERTSEKHD